METLIAKTDTIKMIRQILQNEYNKNENDTNHNFLTRFAIAIDEQFTEESKHLAALIENKEAFIFTLESKLSEMTKALEDAIMGEIDSSKFEYYKKLIDSLK